MGSASSSAGHEAGDKTSEEDGMAHGDALDHDEEEEEEEDDEEEEDSDSDEDDEEDGGFNMVFSPALVRNLQGLGSATEEAGADGAAAAAELDASLEQARAEEERAERIQRDQTRRELHALARREDSALAEAERLLSGEPAPGAPPPPPPQASAAGSGACAAEKGKFAVCLQETGSISECHHFVEALDACVAQLGSKKR